MAAIIFPTPAQALLQTPLNTFSPTSTPLFNTSNSFTYVYNTTLGVWEGSASGGGGGGGVTGVTATAPLASSGGAAPNISLTGTIPVLNGGTGATTISGAQANLLPAQAGNAGKVLSTDGAGVLSWAAAGGFPSGTTMPFYQAAAPLGWTQITTAALNDTSIRLVTGAGGGTGGTVPFSTLFTPAYPVSGTITFAGGNVGNTVLSASQLASHNHSIDVGGNPGAGSALGVISLNSGNEFVYGGMSSSGSNDPHTHSLAGASSPVSLAGNFDVKYANFIICSKS
jgi:hypothetical protein